jgi:phage/plasmid primase-like uncharacterized protein
MSMETDHVKQLADALRDAGLVLKGDPIMDDRIHRVDVEGKPGGRDGSYKAKVEGDRAFGWFRNWTTQTETQPWHANGSPRLTREQRRHLADQRAAHDAQHAKTMQEQHERAAAECQALWQGAIPTDTHPYLTRKGVPSYGLRQGAPGQALTVTGEDGAPRTIDLAGRLFIPMRGVHCKLWSLQYINDDGRKMYHPSGRKEGCFFYIPGDGYPHFVAEGYATAATVHQLSASPVLVAFDTGNLLPVVRAFHREHPEFHIAVAGDNDHSRERELDAQGNPKPNVGKLAAIEAAEPVGGVVVLPEFEVGVDDKSTDWNDLVQKLGLEHARASFRRACKSPSEIKGRGAYEDAHWMAVLGFGRSDVAVAGPLPLVV